MSRSIGLAHLVRGQDGMTTGVWGVCTLKSAFQPIFAFDRGRLSVAAFEGLVRPFRDSQPWAVGAFFASLSAAERLHVETLTRTLHLLNAAAFLPSDVLLFVNFDPSLFAGQAARDAALRELRLVLHETGIDPARIVCELTEQNAPSPDDLFAFAQALRACGFQIAVDDYGADNSDLERIAALRPDIVKFDGDWVAWLMDSKEGFTVLRTMTAAFAEQGIRTVFEGIEHGSQLELAEKAGASMVQGYALARPELAPACFGAVRRPDTPLEQPPAPVDEAAALPLRAAVRPQRSFGRRIAS